MVDLVQTIDLSHSRLTPYAADLLRAQGFTRCIVGIRYDNLPLTRDNLAVASQAGFEVEAYAYLWWGGDVGERIRRSIDLIQPYGGRLWPDLEDNGEGTDGIPNPSVYPPSRIVDLIGVADAACEDYPHGKYSARWWWVPATGNSQLWAGDDWWIADYDGVADLNVFRPFGGITQLTGKQYQGTTDLYGMTVDLSVFAPSAVTSEPAPSAPTYQDLANALGYASHDLAEGLEAEAMRKGGPRKSQVLAIAGKLREQSPS